MKCKIGIIATSLLVCSLAVPAWAELSETASAGEEATGHPLSAPEHGRDQSRVNSFLDRFAGNGISGPSSGENYNPSIDIVPPISETTLFSAFTRADSPMNAYYSRLGTDNSGTITALSRSAAFAVSAVRDSSALPEAGLAAAAIQGHFVGSGAVVGSVDIGPMQGASSSPSVIQTVTTAQQTVPLPLPFLLTGSGLAALLALRKRVRIEL
jgi:hypothetical protein